jgi:peptide/nickel transport system permease protein
MTHHPDNRYVDETAFDADSNLHQPERGDMDAPNAVLVWRKFKTHRLGLISAIFLLSCYLLLPVIGFFAPYSANDRFSDNLYSPPQSVHFYHQGDFLGPFIYPLTAEADLETFQWVFKPDFENPKKLTFFCEGSQYRIAGLIKANTHLFCAPQDVPLFIWGSDRLGRDVFSRILYGAQLSLTVGLIGITVSLKFCAAYLSYRCGWPYLQPYRQIGAPWPYSL